MALFFEQIFFSIIDLLKGSVTVAVPLFALIAIGSFVRKRFENALRTNWFFSALASTLLIVWILLALVYFYPNLQALQEQQVGIVPSPFAPSVLDVAYSIALGFVKVSVAAIVLSFLLMPLEFAGLYIHTEIAKKYKKLNPIALLAATSYVCAVFGSAIVLFLIPQAVTGFFYFLYFGL